MTAVSNIRLWQLISPTLPIGSFAYSQGLEYAVDDGWVNNEDETLSWVRGQLKNTLSVLDVPVMQRCYRAWQADDYQAVLYWNSWILASRGAKELRDEDLQLGQALQRVLLGLDTQVPVKDIEWSYITMFAFAAVQWGIPFCDAATGFLWSWSENQVAAAIKLVPLGQTSGQKILAKITSDIPVAVEFAEQISDDDIGVSAPCLGIASALHETQYSRLFRS